MQKPLAFTFLNIFNMKYILNYATTEYYTEVHLHCFLRKRYSSWSVTRLIVANKKSDDENNITWKTPIYLCFRRNKTGLKAEDQ
jgi:hypothetical protein